MTRKLNLQDGYLNHIVDSIIGAVPTERIYVFGSYARGEERPDSDLDLYVITSDDGKRPLEHASIVRRALLWMPQPKDVLCSTSKRFEERKTDLCALEYDVAREGVQVYG